MPFSHRYLLYPPRQHTRPGCWFYVLCFVALIIVGWYSLQNGTLAMVVQNKPLFTIPLTASNGIALAQHPHTHPHSVIGKPSLSAQFVDRVLAGAHSPAIGTGQALYALSMAYSIDDAYALAFFEHESMYGTTGMARVTYALGNIRCSAGYACINGYRAYDNWVQGATDWFHLISTLYITQWHLRTVEQIVPVYAPPSDRNDVPGYIQAVERAVDRWRQGKI